MLVKISIFIFIVLISYLICSLLYLKFGIFKSYFHNKLHWHLPKEDMFFDGCSIHSKCIYCNKEIMQDSQGNWFTTK